MKVVNRTFEPPIFKAVGEYKGGLFPTHQNIAFKFSRNIDKGLDLFSIRHLVQTDFDAGSYEYQGIFNCAIDFKNQAPSAEVLIIEIKSCVTACRSQLARLAVSKKFPIGESNLDYDDITSKFNSEIK